MTDPRWEALRKAAQAHVELHGYICICTSCDRFRVALAALEEPAPVEEGAHTTCVCGHGRSTHAMWNSETGCSWVVGPGNADFCPCREFSPAPVEDGPRPAGWKGYGVREGEGVLTLSILEEGIRRMAKANDVPWPPAPSEAPDRGALVAEVAALRAEVDDLGNAFRVVRESCQAERAMGNGGCGCCTLCNKESRERAEAAEAALATERARALEEAAKAIEGACNYCDCLAAVLALSATSECDCDEGYGPTGCAACESASPPPAPAPPVVCLCPPGFPQSIPWVHVPSCPLVAPAPQGEERRETCNCGRKPDEPHSHAGPCRTGRAPRAEEGT